MQELHEVMGTKPIYLIAGNRYPMQFLDSITGSTPGDRAGNFFSFLKEPIVMARSRMFTNQQIRSIRRKREKGATWKSIAEEYNVSIPTIVAIVNRITYQDVV